MGRITGRVQGTWPTKKQAVWISALTAIAFAAIYFGVAWIGRVATARIRFACEVPADCERGTPAGTLFGEVERREIVQAFGFSVIAAIPGERPIVSDECSFEEVSR